VRVVTDYVASMGLPAPPQGANSNDIFMRQMASGNPWNAINLKPYDLAVTENQTADSRYDLRYGNPTFQDYLFGSRIYRGGLFAGYAADPSRVGRSYLRFTLPSLANGVSLAAASVNAYYMRSAASGSATIGCHGISAVWTAATLKWSTAPSVTPGTPLSTVTVSYDPMNPVSSWQHWAVATVAGPNFYSGGLFGAALASTNEATTAWAYFAKQEYDATLAPRLLYATVDTVEEVSLTVSPTAVTGGTSATGTVTLTGGAPNGGSPSP
jgi:hypothetical protein